MSARPYLGIQNVPFAPLSLIAFHNKILFGLNFLRRKLGAVFSYLNCLYLYSPLDLSIFLFLFAMFEKFLLKNISFFWFFYLFLCLFLLYSLLLLFSFNLQWGISGEVTTRHLENISMWQNLRSDHLKTDSGEKSNNCNKWLGILWCGQFDETFENTRWWNCSHQTSCKH